MWTGTEEQFWADRLRGSWQWQEIKVAMLLEADCKGVGEGAQSQGLSLYGLTNQGSFKSQKRWSISIFFFGWWESLFLVKSFSHIWQILSVLMWGWLKLSMHGQGSSTIGPQNEMFSKDVVILLEETPNIQKHRWLIYPPIFSVISKPTFQERRRKIRVHSWV